MLGSSIRAAFLLGLSLFSSSACDSALDFAGFFTDVTVYPADATPDVPLRQVVQAAAVPPEIRLRLAAAGILQIDLLLSLDDTQAGNVSEIKGILPVRGAKLKAISASSDTLREDPLKIPEISDVDYPYLPIELLCRSPSHHLVRK